MNGQHISVLSEWIGIESFTRDVAGVNRMMDLVQADASVEGIACERLPGRDGLGDAVVLRAGQQNGHPSRLLLAHLDTVHPAGTLQKLPVRVYGDRLYGPGAYDMKGGAYCAFQAFLSVHRQSADRPVIYLFTPDEEIGSPTSREIIENLARGASCVLVAEPARAGGRVVTARKGVARFFGEVGARARCAQFSRPFPERPLPNPACQSLGTGLSTCLGHQVSPPSRGLSCSVSKESESSTPGRGTGPP
jgi:glutamate carboxypeptidase